MEWRIARLDTESDVLLEVRMEVRNGTAEFKLARRSTDFERP
jgi:hypothetical protein